MIRATEPYNSNLGEEPETDDTRSNDFYWHDTVSSQGRLQY